MADHVRKQIRDAAEGKLNPAPDGLTTSKHNVFASRVHPMQDDDLPGLRLYTNDEEIEPLDGEDDAAQDRKLELVVECCAKKSDDMDDQLDTMQKEVEVALQPHLTGAQFHILTKVETELDGDSEAAIGIRRLTYEVTYYVKAGTPDVPINAS